MNNCMESANRVFSHKRELLIIASFNGIWQLHPQRLVWQREEGRIGRIASKYHPLLL